MSKRKLQQRTAKLPSKRVPEPLHPAWIPSVAGLAVSAYLFGLDLLGAPAFCLTQNWCDIVRGSAFGRILGMPVAAAGVLFFAAVLGLSLTRHSWRDRWLGPLGGIGAGASVVFVGLQLIVIRAICPYCLLADAAALAVAYLVLKDTPRAGRIRAATSAALVAVILSAIYAWTPTQSTGSDYAAGLARHLTQSGAVMYGAFWCPHCREQKALFGSAADLLPYVECDPRSPHEQFRRCRARGVRVFPTWEFRGELVEGILQLDELARRSGYAQSPSTQGPSR